ncbi:MAG: transcription-repair coupling factor [Pseudohongiellaceae bacterium]
MSSVFAPPLPSEPQQAVYWARPFGAAGSLVIANAAARCDGPLLLITENNEMAEAFRRELSWFGRRGVTDDEGVPVFSLPDWETLPYDNFSPHQDITSDRIAALHQLPTLKRGILVVSVSSLMHRLPPRSYIAANSLVLECGQQFSIEQMREEMIQAGYQSVDSVYEHGEFAVRGSIMDIFPMGSPQPIRIDLLDDEIDTLRSFDPETQLSAEQIEYIRLLPAREFPLDEAAIARFRAAFHERFDVDPRQCPLYQDVSGGLNSPGLEYYLALFFEGLDSLFDYLPPTTVCCRIGETQVRGREFWQDLRARFEDRQVDRYRPVLPVREVFIPLEDVNRAINDYRQIQFHDVGDAVQLDSRPLPDVASDARLQTPLRALQEFMQAQPVRVLFCAESAGRRETLIELLKQIDLNPQPFEYFQDFYGSDALVGITVAPVDQALWLPEAGIALISESQLFGNRIAQRRRRRTGDNTDFIVKSLTELHLNDAVVHIDHGVGRYRGLETITTDGETTEFLILEYANQARLYVPVASLHLISRYSGAEEEVAPLHTLGTEAWHKAKRKAAEKIRDVAAELLDIYARREAKKGYRYQLERSAYDRFVASFPFEETPDQQQAIDAVVSDMTGSKITDRLVCGDVGFGKTEVAMRAAFVAVQNNRQVAVLVPTTLLAQQHFDTFTDRFADWPFMVEVISRFKTARQQDIALQSLTEGKIDILIGTHKLLNRRIDYKNLGLLIIDEEHRFGVRQKELLKSLRANVDILTLTATPIPRTLNMALSGIRDLSLIVTPPARRLSVKTFVREKQDSIIKEAMSRELLRGGQIFYLHNEVKSIDRAAAHLAEIVPNARICVGHGQMPERRLERVMADFYHKRYNILVCTTIIETGIDIPSANTILIDRADRLGLAQLHQLRGRVGRSHHQAYAYLLLPGHGRMTPDALKRIEAIQAATTLGAGFTLASHDLEIRGAGELLGEEQSGHIQKIGFSLYTELLEDAVQAMRAGRQPGMELDMDRNIDINLRIPALIPEDYLPDVHTRLIIYKRISASRSSDELRELQVEMIDRFGLLPQPLKLLFRLTEMKLRAEPFGIRRIDANVSGGRVEFKQDTRVDPNSIVRLIQAEPQAYRLSGANQLHFSHDSSNAEERIDVVGNLLGKLVLLQQAAA